jgi:glutaredoxin 3
MKTLTVYTKPGCSYCANAKDYLKMIDIPFTEIDISKDDAARNKILLAGHRTLPVIYAGEQVLAHGGFTTLKTMRKEDILERLA